MALCFSQLKTSLPKLLLALPTIPAMLTLSPLLRDRHPEQVIDPKIRFLTNPRWPSQSGPHKVSGDRPFCRGSAWRGIIIVFVRKRSLGSAGPCPAPSMGIIPMQMPNALALSPFPLYWHPACFEELTPKSQALSALHQQQRSELYSTHTRIHACLLIKLTAAVSVVSSE